MAKGKGRIQSFRSENENSNYHTPGDLKELFAALSITAATFLYLDRHGRVLLLWFSKRSPTPIVHDISDASFRPGCRFTDKIGELGTPAESCSAELKQLE